MTPQVRTNERQGRARQGGFRCLVEEHRDVDVAGRGRVTAGHAAKQIHRDRGMRSVFEECREPGVRVDHHEGVMARPRNRVTVERRVLLLTFASQL